MKYFIFFIIVGFGIINQVFGNEINEKKYSIIIEKKNLFIKQLLLSKQELINTENGKLWIEKIDTVVPLLEDEKSIYFYKKIQKINTNDIKYNTYKYHLRYLYSRLGLKIHESTNIITGSTTYYNKYYVDDISSNRDLERIENIDEFSLSIKMSYYKNMEYPSNIQELEKLGIKFPVDPKQGESNKECEFGYTYKTLHNEYGKNQKYILSTCLENKVDGSFIYKKGN